MRLIIFLLCGIPSLLLAEELNYNYETQKISMEGHQKFLPFRYDLEAGTAQLYINSQSFDEFHDTGQIESMDHNWSYENLDETGLVLDYYNQFPKLITLALDEIVSIQFENGETLGREELLELRAVINSAITSGELPVYNQRSWKNETSNFFMSETVGPDGTSSGGGGGR